MKISTKCQTLQESLEKWRERTTEQEKGVLNGTIKNYKFRSATMIGISFSKRSTRIRPHAPSYPSQGVFCIRISLSANQRAIGCAEIRAKMSEEEYVDQICRFMIRIMLQPNGVNSVRFRFESDG